MANFVLRAMRSVSVDGRKHITGEHIKSPEGNVKTWKSEEDAQNFMLAVRENRIEKSAVEIIDLREMQQ